MGLLYQGGILHFGESRLTPLDALTAKREEPFYLYDLDGMRTRARALRSAYPGLEVHYAVKANATERILRVFREEGTGVDVVSGGEISCALAAGFEPKDIIFSGVGKTRSEIRLAIELGIKQINVESPQELERIVSTARAMGKQIGRAHV